MKTIFFLGNVGKQYEFTRHNAAWILSDFIIKSNVSWSFVANKRLDVLECKISLYGKDVLLIKPTTLMNRSGKAVIKTYRYYYCIRRLRCTSWKN